MSARTRSFSAVPVLADQHEAGKENRFERYDHRQQTERERIELRHAERQTLTAIQTPNQSRLIARKNMLPLNHEIQSATRCRR
jgi:hypothetical protein